MANARTTLTRMTNLTRTTLWAAAIAALASAATAQQPTVTPAAPVAPAPVTTGALPATAASVVPQQIGPIVPPAVVAPIARTRPTTTAAAGKLPACKPGERVKRKVGTCVPITTAAVAKPAPAKAATKLVKAKPINKRS